MGIRRSRESVRAGLVALSLLGALACACANGDPIDADGTGTGDTDIPATSTGTDAGAGDDTDDTNLGTGSTDDDAAAPSSTPDAATDPPGPTDKDAGPADKDAGPANPPDGGPQPTCVTTAPSNACGLDPQCGCAANETCEVTKADGTVACAAAGSASLGHPCAQASACAPGLTCVDGACRPYCKTPDKPCTGTGLGSCFAPQDANDKTSPNKSYCSTTCDVLSPTSACGTNNCVWFSDVGEDCVGAGKIAGGQSCGSITDCKQGFACVDASGLGDYACEQYCDLTSPNCQGGLTCTDAFGTNGPTSGGHKVGLCK